MDDLWLEDFDNLSLNDDEEEASRSLLTFRQYDYFLNQLSNHTTYQTIPIASSIQEYLTIVKSNILSEYNGFLNQSSQTKIEAKFSFDEYGHVIFTYARQSRDLPKQEDITLPELHHHAMIYQGHLCISRYHGTKKVIILKEGGRWEGRSIPTNLFNDVYGYEEIIDLGYIGDLLNEYSACCAIYINTPSIMHSIVAPRNRRRVEYGKDRPLSDSVPINDRQLSILNNLQYDIEAIQGPPGTGKSTTIYHIVNSFLPEGSVTLATCVQNKAVDAIAEKFAKVNNIKFFVYGNEQRLGMLAKEWTLDSQVMRDSRVISIIRAQYNFNSLRKLFYEKTVVEKWVELRRKKREKAADEKFGDDNDILLDTPEYEEKRLWIINDVWGRCISAYSQSKTTLLRAIRKYLNKRGSELCLELKLSEQVARTELIASSNVILCTIATASRSLLTEFDLNVKVHQINTAILDEAGNCPEHKLPLLAMLPSLQRIIMIGDQKQLQPFTYISNKDNNNNNIRGGRSDGICRNFLKGYCSYGNSCHFKHSKNRTTKATNKDPLGVFQRIESSLPSGSVQMLSEQYRMHPIICQIVSNLFYQDILTTNTNITALRVRVDPIGLYILSSLSPEETPPRSTSKHNIGEADYVVDIINSGLYKHKSIMIITFYKSQEVLIRKKLNEAKIYENADEEDSLRVLTVDQAQGSEADIVILSCVRSNLDSSIGFLSNANRMNVAISRVRQRLIIICDIGTLSSNANWCALFERSRVISSISSLPTLNNN